MYILRAFFNDKSPIPTSRAVYSIKDGSGRSGIVWVRSYGLESSGHQEEVDKNEFVFPLLDLRHSLDENDSDEFTLTPYLNPKYDVLLHYQSDVQGTYKSIEEMNKALDTEGKVYLETVQRDFNDRYDEIQDIIKRTYKGLIDASGEKLNINERYLTSGVMDFFKKKLDFFKKKKNEPEEKKEVKQEEKKEVKKKNKQEEKKRTKLTVGENRKNLIPESITKEWQYIYIGDSELPIGAISASKGNKGHNYSLYVYKPEDIVENSIQWVLKPNIKKSLSYGVLKEIYNSNFNECVKVFVNTLLKSLKSVLNDKFKNFIHLKNKVDYDVNGKNGDQEKDALFTWKPYKGRTIPAIPFIEENETKTEDSNDSETTDNEKTRNERDDGESGGNDDENERKEAATLKRIKIGRSSKLADLVKAAKYCLGNQDFDYDDNDDDNSYVEAILRLFKKMKPTGCLTILEKLEDEIDDESKETWESRKPLIDAISRISNSGDEPGNLFGDDFSDLEVPSDFILAARNSDIKNEKKFLKMFCDIDTDDPDLKELQRTIKKDIDSKKSTKKLIREIKKLKIEDDSRKELDDYLLEARDIYEKNKESTKIREKQEFLKDFMNFKTDCKTVKPIQRKIKEILSSAKTTSYKDLLKSYNAILDKLCDFYTDAEIEEREEQKKREYENDENINDDEEINDSEGYENDDDDEEISDSDDDDDESDNFEFDDDDDDEEISDSDDDDDDTDGKSVDMDEWNRKFEEYSRKYGA